MNLMQVPVPQDVLNEHKRHGGGRFVAVQGGINETDFLAAFFCEEPFGDGGKLLTHVSIAIKKKANNKHVRRPTQQEIDEVLLLCQNITFEIDFDGLIAHCWEKEK